MTSVMISNIPEELLQRLRKKAKLEQTSIQEQILQILAESLEACPNFVEGLDRFYEKYPRGEGGKVEEDPFGEVRSQDSGREFEL